MSRNVTSKTDIRKSFVTRERTLTEYPSKELVNELFRIKDRINKSLKDEKLTQEAREKYKDVDLKSIFNE